VSHTPQVRSLADLLPVTDNKDPSDVELQRSSLQLVSDNAALAPKPGSTTPGQGNHKEEFLQSLPGLVGTDVVAVSSDLHYLNVWTVAGRSTVLGNLRDVASDLAEKGMQVHRSHWVAHAHVRRIVGTASNASCIMSNELRVPISRRRWKSVREQYGRGVIHTASAEEKRASGD